MATTTGKETLIDRLRAPKTCDEEPARCYLDSGPMCGTHADNDVFAPLLREAADEIERLATAVRAASHVTGCARFEDRLFSLFTLFGPEGSGKVLFSKRLRVVAAMIAAMEAELQVAEEAEA